MRMEPSATIKSADDDTRMIFSDASGESFATVLESAQFSGRVLVSTYHSGPPSLLFEDMARQWQGWEGKKQWVALEDELRLTASSDLTGHIELTVVMRDYSGPADWRLQATLRLEAGQLEETARAVKKVFQHVQIA
jgi:Family of unknown function (DUF6228)